MATVTLKGNPVNVSRHICPGKGASAPEFSLTNKDLEGRRTRGLRGQAQSAQHRAQPGHAYLRASPPACSTRRRAA